MTTVDIPAQIAADITEQITEQITAQIEKDAFKKGRDEGHDEGEVMGVRRSLVRLYERRFGEIPKAIRAHIDNTCELARLEAWLDLAITESAQTLAQHILAP